MRSVDAPRVQYDATVEIGEKARGRAINLSTGGILVSSEESLEPGAQVQLKVNLHDGSSPLAVGAEVVRRGEGGMALRFVDIDEISKQRIQRLIQRREPTIFGRRDVRIHLPSLPAPLRASARDLTERGVMIEAELPWLKLGSSVTAELSQDRACEGRVSWIGIDVTRSGAARLRMFVDLSGDEKAPLGIPPDSIAGVDEASSLPPRRHLIWPAIAVTALIAVGAMAIALTMRPPTPTLLPTAPPERDEIAVHIPPRTSVPKEGQPLLLPAATNTLAAATQAASSTQPSSSLSSTVSASVASSAMPASTAPPQIGGGAAPHVADDKADAKGARTHVSKPARAKKRLRATRRAG
jgi:hypothetical protein